MNEHCGARYEFALDKRELFVRETYALRGESSQQSSKRTLRLLNLSWQQMFTSSKYPLRLKQLYSQWYWSEANCIVFRPLKASDRRIFFVLTFDSTEGSDTGALPCKCYEVPETDLALQPEDVKCRLPNYDRFVCLNDSVASVISKLEAREFIHVVQNGSKTQVKLPRLNLSFSFGGFGALESDQYSGYVLKQTQQMDGDLLPRFAQYLVLEQNSDVKAPVIRILMPEGCVEQSNTTGMMTIRVDPAADARVPIVCYDQHRRLGTLVAETISSRLQLATVYASGGTSVLCSLHGMTGAEAAIEQLRCCSSSRLYSTLEANLLANVSAVGYREPSLKLLAKSLFDHACKLAFMEETGPDIVKDQIHVRRSLMVSTDEKDRYAEMCSDPLERCQPRFQLPSELDHLVNPVLNRSAVSGTTPIPSKLSLPPSPIAENYVSMIENKLKGFVESQSITRQPRFPLKKSVGNTLGTAMHNELEKSWHLYHSLPECRIVSEFSRNSTLFQCLNEMLHEVASMRDQAHAYLNRCYAEAISDPRSQFRRVMTFAVGKLNLMDLLRCGMSKATIGQFMPRLGYQGQMQFLNGARQLLELCVLEDKLQRLVAMVGANQGDTALASQVQQLVIEELLCVRQWRSADHPQWLAFEVEGRIQIRHEQYIVAKHLLATPGSVSQLNMGRGKTRVILPMLFMEFASQMNGSKRAAQATILTPLMSELRHFLQRHMVTGSVGLKVVEMPFHRRIAIDVRAVKLLLESVQRAKYTYS